MFSSQKRSLLETDFRCGCAAPLLLIWFGPFWIQKKETRRQVERFCFCCGLWKTGTKLMVEPYPKSWITPRNRLLLRLPSLLASNSIWSIPDSKERKKEAGWEVVVSIFAVLCDKQRQNCLGAASPQSRITPRDQILLRLPSPPALNSIWFIPDSKEREKLQVER